MITEEDNELTTDVRPEMKWELGFSRRRGKRLGFLEVRVSYLLL